MKHSRVIASTATTWSFSLSLMLAGTVDYHSAHDWRHVFLFWGCWFGFVALIPTHALIVGYYADRNRDTQHEVVDVVSAAARQSPPRAVR